MFTFTKEEKLCGKATFDQLIAEGKSFFLFPFKVTYLCKVDGPPFVYPAQMAISVPKRRHKLAVTRNLIKRRVREAYRKVKESLFYSFLIEHDLFCQVLFMYAHDQIADFLTIENKMRMALMRLRKELLQNLPV